LKAEVNRFGNGKLQLRVRFEECTNFWVRDLTWVPTKEEVRLIFEALDALDGYNTGKTEAFTSCLLSNGYKRVNKLKDSS